MFKGKFVKNDYALTLFFALEVIKIIIVGSDHGGYELKRSIVKYLIAKKVEVKDLGTFSTESVDYPDIAKNVCDLVVADSPNSTGILVCGTGIGMSIAANKIKGIRAALLNDSFSAVSAKKHNDANVICLGQRVLGKDLALFIMDIFLSSDFEGERHQLRIDKITDFES